jgi:branched-chain amino acid aminotransferase
MGRYLPAEEGIRVCISSWIRVPDNAIPPRAKVTGSYINTSLAKTESLLAGYDEALFLDREGHVVEGSAENLFVVRDGKVCTPPVADDILQGITRDTVMTLCKNELGLQIEERSIDRSEIYQVDEVFLVGTGAEVSPVREIDGRVIGSGAVGPIASQVKKLYFDIVHGNVTKYNSWVTKVKK